jgi:transglutaminase-like putative cysteine protease
MRYTVRHVTRFTYESPITESVMEARMQPRSDGFQRCVHFALTTSPQARVMTYPDHDGNAVHHFDIPTRHSRLAVTAEALVDSIERPPMPGTQRLRQADARARHIRAGASTGQKRGPFTAAAADHAGHE